MFKSYKELSVQYLNDIKQIEKLKKEFKFKIKNSNSKEEKNQLYKKIYMCNDILLDLYFAQQSIKKYAEREKKNG